MEQYKKYIIQSSGQSAPAATKLTSEDAYRTAEDLARKNPQRVYTVYEAVASFKANLLPVDKIVLVPRPDYAMAECSGGKAKDRDEEEDFE